MATPAPQAANGGHETKRKRRARKRKERAQEEEQFFSPVGSPVAAVAAPPQQRRKASPGLHPAAKQQQVQPPRGDSQQQHANQAAASGSTPTRLPMRGKRVSPHRQNTAAKGAAELGAAEASGAAETAAAQAGAQPPSQSAPSGQEDQRQEQASSPPAAGMLESKRRRRKKGRKTLTAKGKRAAILGVLAEAEVAKMAETGAAAAPQARRVDGSSGQQQQQQQQAAQPAAPAPQPAPPAAAARAAAPSDPAATANLGRAWSKADIATLARLAEDRTFLVQTVVGHPADGELDWELISRHFGRYSRGGVAVRQQYYSVVRLMKAARHEGRKGASYVDLVCGALRTLDNRQGSIFDVQAVLKRDHSRCLDKYRVKGVLRWKTAVREVLTDNPELFEQAGKTPTGKILWRLREAALMLDCREGQLCRGALP